jgi:hypothetical protein
VEIDCPSDCVHLTSAREHPAATIKRQQEQDVGRLLPTIRHLTERQYQLFFLFHTAIARHVPDGFARLVDADVADAAAALASTSETASRGVIYEHAAASLPAQRLAADMKTVLEEMRKQGATIYDGEVAIALRAIEAGAREIGSAASGATYLDLMRRLLQVKPQSKQEDARQGSALILP